MKAALIALAGIFALLVLLLWLDLSRRFARILFADYIDTAKMQATLANGRVSDPEMYYLEMLGPAPRMWRVAMWRAGVFVFDFALTPAAVLAAVVAAVALRSAALAALAVVLAACAAGRVWAHVRRRRENGAAMRDAAQAMFGDSYTAAPPAERRRMEDFAQTNAGQWIATRTNGATRGD